MSGAALCRANGVAKSLRLALDDFEDLIVKGIPEAADLASKPNAIERKRALVDCRQVSLSPGNAGVAIRLTQVIAFGGAVPLDRAGRHVPLPEAEAGACARAEGAWRACGSRPVGRRLAGAIPPGAGW